MPFVDMIDEGWNVTRNKMRADIANDDERFDDLMDFYQTTEEQEVAIMMPMPTPEQQMELCRAFDLNPLI